MNLTIPPQIDPEDPEYIMDDTDLLYDALEHVMPGDYVYFGLGSAIDHVGTSTLEWSEMEEATAFMELLGEMAEKPVKGDSKVERLHTRHHQIPGRRTSTIEMTINGLSEKQIRYLESDLFTGQDVSIIISEIPEEQMDSFCPAFRVLLIDAARWTVDWSGEADGLFSVVISTTINGSTNGKVLAFTCPAGPGVIE